MRRRGRRRALRPSGPQLHISGSAETRMLPCPFLASMISTSTMHAHSSRNSKSYLRTPQRPHSINRHYVSDNETFQTS